MALEPSEIANLRVYHEALREWKQLHDKLNVILKDSGLFSTAAERLGAKDRPTNIVAFTPAWQTVRQEVDELLDWARDIEYIGKVYRLLESGAMIGEKWAVQLSEFRDAIDTHLRLVPSERGVDSIPSIYLHQQLIGHFNEGDLRTLCFYLDVDYDDLRGQERTSRARELIIYLERRGRIRELVTLIKHLRPAVRLVEDSPERLRWGDWWSVLRELTRQFSDAIINHMNFADKRLQETADNLYKLSKDILWSQEE